MAGLPGNHLQAAVQLRGVSSHCSLIDGVCSTDLHSCPYRCVWQAVKSQDCLEIMGKLLYNCAVSPREEKYRRIKLTNKRLAETLGANTAALEALTALGWVEDAANAHELVVPEGLYFTMKEVRGCVTRCCVGSAHTMYCCVGAACCCATACTAWLSAGCAWFVSGYCAVLVSGRCMDKSGCWGLGLHTLVFMASDSFGLDHA
jgi:hypothetical protein